MDDKAARAQLEKEKTERELLAKVISTIQEVPKQTGIGNQPLVLLHDVLGAVRKLGA